MALITCAECGRKISDQATSCPGCGAPPRSDGIQAQTIEQTSKRLKGQLLIWVVVTAVALSFAIVGQEQQPMPLSGVIGFAVFSLSAVMVFVTKIRMWWHHG